MVNTKKRLVVIDGGPGTGKTSVVKWLKKRGYKVMPETARIILSKDRRFKGKDAVQARGIEFQKAIWEYEWKRYKKIIKNNSSKLVFFDRGFYDGFVYCKLDKVKVPNKIYKIARKIHYYQIFIVSPLPKKYYSTDKKRKETYSEALKIHRMLIKEYGKHRYKPVNVPFDTIENRGLFILKKLKINR